MTQGLVLVAVVVALWLCAAALMYRGYRNRRAKQEALIDGFPQLPANHGALIGEPLPGLYVGTTTTDSWQDRIVVDVNIRARAYLQRFSDGIVIDRQGATPLWIANGAVESIRTAKALAGKVMGFDGLLIIRWRLANGFAVDSGFRANDKSVYPAWVTEGKAK